MKKAFLSVVIVSVFTLLFSMASQATSLEAYSFTGHITQDFGLDGPVYPKLGDTFVGQFLYICNPMLEPVVYDPSIYEPVNNFYVLSDNWTLRGSIMGAYTNTPGGMDTTIGMAAGFSRTFVIDDMGFSINAFGGSFEFSTYSTSGPYATDNIIGTFDYVSYSSIPMNVKPVPEPATMLLFGTGLVGIVGSRLGRKKK